MLVTCLHGIVSNLGEIQTNLFRASRQLGVDEAAVFAYNDEGEKDEDKEQRADHILGPMDNGETVVIQSEAGVSLDLEQKLIDRVRRFPNTKLVLMIDEIRPLTIQVHVGLHNYARLFNQADVLIVQTPQMKQYIRYLGVNHPHIVISGLFDLPTELHPGMPQFQKRISSLYFAEEKLPFTRWTGTTDFRILGQRNFPGAQRENINDRQAQIERLNQLGGFGIVPEQNRWGYTGYFEKMISFATSVFLAANLPLIARRGSATADFIAKYQLGMIYDDPADVDQMVQSVNADMYHQYATNAAKMGSLVRQGHFTVNALLKANYLAKLSDGRDAQLVPDNSFKIHVMNNMETVDYINKYHPSVARLGDGEIAEIVGLSQTFQKSDPELSKRLGQIAKMPSDHHLLICQSDVFHDLDRYVDDTQDWWKSVLADFHPYYRAIEKTGNTYGNTMVTRPYIDLKDRSQAGKVFDGIKQWWAGRDILIAEGKYTRSGVGNDLFANARSVQRILCPPKDAWGSYREIEAAIQKYGQGKLVLLMLGMTATVIAADLADWGQVIDMGHIDPEYEWYKMGAKERVPLKNKHAAEFNHDYNIGELDDPVYQSQIVADLTR